LYDGKVNLVGAFGRSKLKMLAKKLSAAKNETKMKKKL